MNNSKTIDTFQLKDLKVALRVIEVAIVMFAILVAWLLSYANNTESMFSLSVAGLAASCFVYLAYKAIQARGNVYLIFDFWKTLNEVNNTEHSLKQMYEKSPLEARPFIRTAFRTVFNETDK